MVEGKKFKSDIQIQINTAKKLLIELKTLECNQLKTSSDVEKAIKTISGAGYKLNRIHDTIMKYKPELENYSRELTEPKSKIGKIVKYWKTYCASTFGLNIKSMEVNQKEKKMLNTILNSMTGDCDLMYVAVQQYFMFAGKKERNKNIPISVQDFYLLRVNNPKARRKPK